MKRRLSYLLIIFISVFIFNSDVEAKKLEKTCNYSSNDIEITCKFYSNNSHSCVFSNSDKKSNSENLQNWGKDNIFNAKEFYKNNKQCFQSIVFVDRHTAINRYDLYAADSIDTATKFLGEIDTTFDDGFVVGNNGESVISDSNILTYISKFDGELVKGLSEFCLFDGSKYYYNANNSGANLCSDEICSVYTKVKSWDEYVEGKISSGALSKDDQIVKDYYSKRDNFKSKLDSNQFANSCQTGSGSGNSSGTGNSDKPIVEDTYKPSTESRGCFFCGNAYFPIGLSTLTRNIFNLIKVLVPVIIIILGMVDLLKAVIASDEKKMDEAKPKLVRKIISGVVIFLVFSIVQFVFGNLLVNTDAMKNSMLECVNYFINEEPDVQECPSRDDPNSVNKAMCESRCESNKGNSTAYEQCYKGCMKNLESSK